MKVKQIKNLIQLYDQKKDLDTSDNNAKIIDLLRDYLKTKTLSDDQDLLWDQFHLFCQDQGKADLLPKVDQKPNGYGAQLLWTWLQNDLNNKKLAIVPKVIWNNILSHLGRRDLINMT